MGLLQDVKALNEAADQLDHLPKVIESLVVSLVKAQILEQERDVDRMIGAIPEHVVEDVMKKHEVPEDLIDLRRVLRIAKNYKKRLR